METIGVKKEFKCEDDPFEQFFTEEEIKVTIMFSCYISGFNSEYSIISAYPLGSKLSALPARYMICIQ